MMVNQLSSPYVKAPQRASCACQGFELTTSNPKACLGRVWGALSRPGGVGKGRWGVYLEVVRVHFECFV